MVEYKRKSVNVIRMSNMGVGNRNLQYMKVSIRRIDLVEEILQWEL